MDKLEQANKNIESLIDTIIEYKAKSKEMYCNYSIDKRESKCKDFDSDCKKCTEDYLSNLKERMMNKYIVK